MQFKVGDRVEVLTPAEGVGKELSNEVGVGTIKAIGNDLSVKVELPGNFHSWWYKPEQLRHAIEEIEIHPTPSITVGTQVRLTGVVKNMDSVGAWIDFPGRDRPQTVKAPFEALEVIRQPFKRGEVVWGCGHDKTEGWLVVADESEGHALAVLVDARPGHNVVSLDVRNYERRP